MDLIILHDGLYHLIPVNVELVAGHIWKDCFEYARMHIETITTHSYDDPRGQGFYLNDGRGTVQGFICE